MNGHNIYQRAFCDPIIHFSCAFWCFLFLVFARYKFCARFLLTDIERHVMYVQYPAQSLYYVFYRQRQIVNACLFVFFFQYSLSSLAVSNSTVKKKMVTRRFKIELIDKSAEAHVIHRKLYRSIPYIITRERKQSG